MKGSIASLITFFVLFIIFTTYTLYNEKMQSEQLKNLVLREKIKQQNWELDKTIIIQEALIQSKFWNDSQMMNKTQLINKYNISYWNNVTITIEIKYFYNNTFTAKYEGNHSINIGYPIELIDKTENITTTNIQSCVCPNINQTKCNEINNTNFNWELHVCTGIPTKYAISVYNSNITKEYQRYLFNGNCSIQC